VQQLPPLRFSSPSASCQQRPATLPEGNQPLGPVAPSAFLTLSRLFSSRCLPALFHAGPAHGVFPSGLIPSVGHRLSRACCPPVVSRPALAGAPAVRAAAVILGPSCMRLVELVRSTAHSGSPHSRAFISTDVCFPPRRIRTRRDRNPPGFYLPRGLFPCRQRVFLGTRPLLGFPAV